MTAIMFIAALLPFWFEVQSNVIKGTLRGRSRTLIRSGKSRTKISNISIAFASVDIIVTTTYILQLGIGSISRILWNPYVLEIQSIHT